MDAPGSALCGWIKRLCLVKIFTESINNAFGLTDKRQKKNTHLASKQRMKLYIVARKVIKKSTFFSPLFRRSASAISP